MSKQVFVTGGVRGIGLAIARAFAEEGCHVDVTGLTEEDVGRFAFPGIQARQLDVTEPDQVTAVIETFDRLDVLVNGAGMILRGGAEHQEEGFQRVLDVNLSGVMRLCYGAYPLLAQSRGCVLNLASMLSFFGSGFAPAYSASKGAIVQLTKSLAIAWAKDGIRVNAIAPGWIETELTRALVEDPERSRELIARTPLARWGRPEDVAGAALFLCSPAAAFITGVVLPVDGGYSIV